MKIAFLDLFYRINGDVHQDRKEILTVDCQKYLSQELPMIDDLCDLEMFEIMRLPVISPTFQKVHPLRKDADIRLKILCCSYFQGCLFIYLFSGEKWNSYLKFY